MSVSSIFANSSSQYDLNQLYAPTSTSSTASLFSTPGTTSATDTDGGSSTSSLSSASASTSVSSEAKLLSELQNLQTSNPAEFKQVTADISTQLQAAAQQASGSQAQTLSSLASKFQQASQTGSLAPLQGGHHHGGGHHHAAPATDSSSSDTTPTDSVFASTSLTGSSTVPTSAASLAAAAYQQSTGQGIGSQISSIIGQVFSKDLGNTSS
jgi:hypothetical protein